MWYYLAASFICSLVLVWVVRQVSYKFAWTAKPRKDRWHKRPTALYGGVGMFIPFFVFAIYLLRAAIPAPPQLNLAWALLIGAVIMFTAGLLDDIWELKPTNKLIAQVVSASLFIWFGGIFPATSWHLVNVGITYIWFIGIINAINLLDNMDGLASGVSIICSLSLCGIILVINPQQFQSSFFVVLILTFVGSILGFWMFNRYPASIFMGDSGSMFLGFILAAIAVPSSLNNYLAHSYWGVAPSIMALLLPATILLVPIFDTSLVTLQRKWFGRPTTQGGRDHSSHRLVYLGLSESIAVIVLCFLALFGGFTGLVMSIAPNSALIFFIINVVFAAFLGIYLGSVKVYPEQDDSWNMNKTIWMRAAYHLTFRFRAAEVLMDIIIIGLSYYLAYYLRFEGLLRDQSYQYINSLPIVVAICIFSFGFFGFYKKIWTNLTMNDLFLCVSGVIVGVVLSVFVIAVCYRFDGYSRSVFVIFGCLLSLGTVFSRFIFNLFDILLRLIRSDIDKKINVLIYGAGAGGRLLLEELQRNPNYKKFKAIRFVDDDPLKQGCVIGGIPVLGKNELADKVDTVDELWISTGLIKNENIDSIMQCFGPNVDQNIPVRRLKFLLEEVF